jgi:hypothetical protein
MTDIKQYHSFISYRHTDFEAVKNLYFFLQEIAGFKIWFDEHNLNTGQNVASQLPKEIEKCWSLILVISSASVESGWVEEEMNFAIGYQKENPYFKIIPVRIDDAKVPGFISNKKWMDVPGCKLTINAAIKLIDAVNNFGDNFYLQEPKDVYLSRSWRQNDSSVADLITNELKKSKEFRFIGDCEDQKSFSESKGISRVELIIKSCGALIAILPDRGEGKTSVPILKEIEIAINLNVPVIIFREEPTEYQIKSNEDVRRVNIQSLSDAKNLSNIIVDVFDSLRENFKIVVDPMYTFWASDFDNREKTDAIQRLIERTTAMPCINGDDINEEQVQSSIIRKISNALIMIADITGNNLNTCIECGIALGAKTRLFILSQGKRETPKPFMLRSSEVFYYESDADQVGKIYKLIRPFRRRVFNNES